MLESAQWLRLKAQHILTAGTWQVCFLVCLLFLFLKEGTFHLVRKRRREEAIPQVLVSGLLPLRSAFGPGPRRVRGEGVRDNDDWVSISYSGKSLWRWKSLNIKNFILLNLEVCYYIIKLKKSIVTELSEVKTGWISNQHINKQKLFYVIKFTFIYFNRYYCRSFIITNIYYSFIFSSYN